MEEQPTPTPSARVYKTTEAQRIAIKKWKDANREQVKEAGRAYYAKNKDRYADNQRKWVAANRETKRASKHRRRAKELGAEGSHTADEVRRLIAAYNHCCAYCQKPITRFELDHRIPLTRGGTDWIENILPACRQCNASKCDRTEDEFRAPNPAPRVIVSRTIPVPEGHAKCSRCGEIKPIDLFYRDQRKKNGHQGWCKSCANSHHKAFINADGREKFRAYMRDYYTKNKERVQASNRKYREKTRLAK